MQLVVGFEEDGAAQGPAFATHGAMRHRPARRQRSLLSESLQSGGSSSSGSSCSSGGAGAASSSPLECLRSARGHRHSFAADSDGSESGDALTPSGSPRSLASADEMQQLEDEHALHSAAGCSSWRGSEPMAIAYSRATRERIAAAEEHGRKRAEQLEMLQAVRAYMAQAQATKAALAAAASRHHQHQHHQQQQQPACA